MDTPVVDVACFHVGIIIDIEIVCTKKLKRSFIDRKTPSALSKNAR